LFTFPDAEVCRIVKNIFQNAINPSFVMATVKQMGNSDCGLYVIAAATCLAYGIDSVGCYFQQSMMRQHLS